MPTVTAPPDPLAGYGNLGGGGISGATGPVTGGGGDFGGLQPQPVSGGNDSLTQFFRSLSNLTGATGAQQFNVGGQTVGAGVGTVGTGLQTLQQPADFYQKLLSGDPATMTAALAPTASLIGKTYAGATQNISQNTPQGGYRSTILAGLPQAEAAQVGNAALGLQEQAAEGLQGISAQQIGAGLGVAGIGQTEQAQGLDALLRTTSQILEKYGLNIQDSTANQFGTIVGAIGNLI